MVRRSLAGLTVVVAVAALGSCGRELRPQQGQPTTPPRPDFAASLPRRVPADPMMIHLKKLQEVAKEVGAGERGGGEVMVDNSEDGDEMGGPLGEKTEVKIPVISVTKATGERMRAEPGPTTIKLNAGVRNERTRNVIAQTKTGSTANVGMVGAHLDSVPAGPGIDDNGPGVAAGPE